MKKLLFVCISASLLAISCGKDDDPTPVTPTDKYMTTTAGSTWNYQFTDNVTPANSNNYTVTSTNQDTTAAGKTYHVFTNSTAPNEYYNITGSDYYRLQVFSLGTTDTTLENLYLKEGAAVNTTWAQNYVINAAGFNVNVTVTNKIQETGLTKTVGANSYSNVIHVVSTITSSTIALIPGATFTNDIHYYYAPKYGMIQNTVKIDIDVPGILTQHTDTKTDLQTATIL